MSLNQVKYMENDVDKKKRPVEPTKIFSGKKCKINSKLIYLIPIHLTPNRYYKDRLHYQLLISSYLHFLCKALENEVSAVA